MTLLVAGLAVFLGVHLLPTLRGARAVLVARSGDRGYRLGFSLVSAAGLLMIVLGYMQAGNGAQLFAPFAAARAVAPYAMTLAFILFAAANMPSHLRANVKHPMLIGLILWSAVHLLANGDLRGTVLFGTFLAYGLVDLASAIGRHATATFIPRLRTDIISVVAGTIVALLVMTFHRPLFGVGVVGFGV
jgi:uncharacterized membrane protein